MASVAKVLNQYRDAIVPISIVACLAVLMVPLPPWLLDLLLAGNIAIAVLILLTTIYVGNPLEFNIFPSMLLATTLSRLVLNIASTRLILTQDASAGPTSAGHVIAAFGEFVSGDRIEVGVILFVMIFLINFVVITKGATRIGEVAARFALDGMPGRQMAIDADLSAGAIDDKEARRRRDEVTRQADFYGAMDGASKFVRGDAVAGIAITFLNLVGGLYMGCMVFGMPVSRAAEVYCKLTIGDGLVSQVPAFLISLAAALLTTRSTQTSNFSQEFLRQIFSKPAPLIVSGVFLCLMIFTSLPAIPMLTMGTGCIGLAWILQKQQRAEERQAQDEAKEVAKRQASGAERKAEELLDVDPLRLELGARLIVLADPNRNGDLIQRIANVRAELATDLGILLPMVRIKDRMSLPPYEYELSLSGTRIAQGELRPGKLLAVDRWSRCAPLDAEEVEEPIGGHRAYWIALEQRQKAESAGYEVMDCGTVLAQHVQESARRFADELLTREVTKQLISQLRKGHTTIVDELIPDVMKLAEVQHVLQNLLREDVPIRPLNVIIETLGDHAHRTRDPEALTEIVRERMARTLSQRYRDEHGVLRVITLDPALEEWIASAASSGEQGLWARIPPASIQWLRQHLASELEKLDALGLPRVVLVRSRIRRALHRLLRESLPQVKFLAYNEISKETRIESVGMLEKGSATQAA
jgi:flagellar biosynthesis protein FlhA